MENWLQKHDNFLSANLRTRLKWSFSQRLIIYKTFCASIINYGGGAFATWFMRQSNPSQKRWLNLLHSSRLLALEFIYGTRHNPTLIASMASLPLPLTLLEHFKASLAREIIKLPTYHPLRHLDIPYGTLLNRDYFAHLIGESPLLNRFLAENARTPPDRRISWKKFLITDRLNACFKLPGILQHYIRPESWLTSSGINILFSSPSYSVQSKVFSWRSNTAFRNKTCHCTVAFNRRHARDCLPIIEFPPRLQDAYAKFESTPTSTHIQQELDDKNSKQTFCFTFVDFCLNQDLNLFLECFDFLSSFVI